MILSYTVMQSRMMPNGSGNLHVEQGGTSRLGDFLYFYFTTQEPSTISFSFSKIFPRYLSPELTEPTPLGVPAINKSPSSNERKLFASFKSWSGLFNIKS